MKNITVSDIKKNNLSLIYKLIYKSGKSSKQEIASQLNLSLPTVSEKIRKLENQGLIKKEGHFESSVGRRAVAYTICSAARIAIGVGIFEKRIRVLSVDLRGEVCRTEQYDIAYKDEDSYFKDVAYHIKDFILESNYLSSQILGIGFAVQGITTVDGDMITFGKTLDYTGLKIDSFSQYLSYPCSFFHDAKCAANTELWFNKEVSNALYLSIGNHLGGAIIQNGQIRMGENGHCGAAEHVPLFPNGRPCYCGQKGCIETYCSINALLEPEENVSDFMGSVRKGIPPYMDRWDEYLKMLGLTLAKLHIFMDSNIILGGELSHYITEEDLLKIEVLTKAQTVFFDSTSYIQLSHYPKDSVTVGASLYYIQDFINQI